jgi:hypothetical protein
MGSLPETVRWRKLVGEIADGANAATVATATANAAHIGLEKAQNDPGLAHVVYLLSKFVLAAREENFSAALGQIAIHGPGEPGLFDLIGGFTEAVDRHMSRSGMRTDIGEMAQLAATETLTNLIRQHSAGLFGTAPEDVKVAVREFSTKKGFSTLAHDFFSRFTQRFLTYHLGRELSNHVGGNGRFADSSEHQEFVQKLSRHCREAAVIVREFAGGWHSKANFEDGISPRKASNFTSVAMTKIRRELKIRGDRDG